MLKPDGPRGVRPARPGSGSPALTALIVYLRPAPRRAVLGLLADCGVLVVEHQGEAGCDDIVADLALVVADQHAASLRVIVALSKLGTPTVACIAPMAAAAPFLEAGAAMCLTDDDFARGGVRLLAPVAAAARARRGQETGHEPGGSVFRGLTFNPALPALSAGTLTRPLSRSERAVLERLVATPGRPVDILELEQCAKAPGSVVQPGFLKAIVLRLRRKAEELGGDPAMLRTIRGFGYVLTG